MKDFIVNSYKALLEAHAIQGALIDLEKTQSVYFGEHIKGLETLVYRALIRRQKNSHIFLVCFLDDGSCRRIAPWYAKLSQRFNFKGACV